MIIMHDGQSLDSGYGDTYAEAYHSSEPEIDIVVAPSIQEVIAGWDRSKKILDIGTGTGRQLHMLQKLGFEEVVGIDKSPNMLVHAKKESSGQVALMEGENLAFPPKTFDYATIGNVLQDFNNEASLALFLREVLRVVRPNGEVLVVTPTVESYTVETAGFDASLYPENLEQITKGKGAPVKVLVKKTGEEYMDYVWSNEDLEEIFEQLGLQILDYKTPLAKESSIINWPSETRSPAWAIYLLRLRNEEGRH